MNGIDAKYTECIYNENGREIKHTTSDGIINFDNEKPSYVQLGTPEEKVYNDNGDLLLYNHEYGYREEWTYDDKNRMLTYKNSRRKEERYIYDMNGTRYPVLLDNGHGYVQKWKYDDRFTTPRVILYENSHGEWNKTTYDYSGQILTHDTSRGYSERYTYNTSGCMLSYKDSKGYWKENTYDDKDNVLSHKNSEGVYEKYIYKPTGEKLLLMRQKDSRVEEWTYNDNYQVIKRTDTLDDLCDEFIYNDCGDTFITHHSSNKDKKSPEVWTYDKDFNMLTYRNSHEYNEFAYNEAGKKISHKLYEF